MPLLTLHQFAERYNLTQHLRLHDAEHYRRGAWHSSLTGPSLAGMNGYIWFNPKGNAHVDPPKELLYQVYGDDTVYAVKCDSGYSEGEVSHGEALKRVGLEEGLSEMDYQGEPTPSNAKPRKPKPKGCDRVKWARGHEARKAKRKRDASNSLKASELR